MKHLTCEMCGSTDMLKQDGVFVCQTCGTKYSVEEAKKMMIEGTVEVTGNVNVTGSTIKIDNAEFVDKYLQNARRAKQKEDWEETEKYYNMVEQNDPHNIEAIFYSSYGKAKQSLVESDLYKRQAAFKVLRNCVSIIDDNYEPDKESESKKAIEQISNDIISMSLSNYVYNKKINGYGIEVWSDKMDTVTLFNQLHSEFYHSLEHIAQSLPETMVSEKIYYYTMAKRHVQFILDNGSLANPSIAKSTRDTYDMLIRKYNEIYAEQQSKEASKRAAEKAKREAEQQAANEAYWVEHADEKQQLESEIAKLQAEKGELESQLDPFTREINAIKDTRDTELPSEKERITVRAEITRLREEQGRLGIFKSKEKKELQAQIDELNRKLYTIGESIEAERKEHQQNCNDRIKEVEERAKPIKDKIIAAEKRISEIRTELTKNR